MHDTYRRHHQRWRDEMRGRHGRGAWHGSPWGGRRARRGDVRTALLTMLAERPMHGYDLIRELENRSGGAWRPSPGSIYPTLQMLEEEGLIAGQDQDGKRVFTLTDTGRLEFEERRQRDGGAAPWEPGADGEVVGQLRDAMFGLGAAAMQVGRTGSDPQRQQATQILDEARKQLYRILAED